MTIEGRPVSHPGQIVKFDRGIVETSLLCKTRTALISPTEV